MLKRSLIMFVVAGLSCLALSCQQTQESNTNANANTPATATTAAPDNSELTTTTDNAGTKTETRVFRDNPRVSKVVVTTRDGQRTVKVYSKTGEERDLKGSATDVLNATGEKIADAAGFVADKSEPVVDKTKEGTKAVTEKATDTAKTVSEKTVDTSKTVANKSTNAAKKVADETKAGAKKTGRTIKKIISP